MKEAEPSRFWWLRNIKYITIFLRELTSVFIIIYVLLYLSILSELKVGNTNLVSSLGSPPLLVLGLVILVFTLYHSVTWFMALQRVQPIKIGSLAIPSGFALVLNLVILMVVSLLIILFMFGVVLTT